MPLLKCTGCDQEATFKGKIVLHGTVPEIVQTIGLSVNVYECKDGHISISPEGTTRRWDNTVNEK